MIDDDDGVSAKESKTKQKNKNQSNQPGIIPDFTSNQECTKDNMTPIRGSQHDLGGSLQSLDVSQGCHIALGTQLDSIRV
jgi:hypothetical protein